MRVARLSAGRPALVATLPPQGSPRSATFSMARSVTFSMAIDRGPVGGGFEGRHRPLLPFEKTVPPRRGWTTGRESPFVLSREDHPATSSYRHPNSPAERETRPGLTAVHVTGQPRVCGHCELSGKWGRPDPETGLVAAPATRSGASGGRRRGSEAAPPSAGVAARQATGRSRLGTSPISRCRSRRARRRTIGPPGACVPCRRCGRGGGRGSRRVDQSGRHTTVFPVPPPGRQLATAAMVVPRNAKTERRAAA